MSSISDIVKLVDEVPQKFNQQLPAIERQMLDEVTVLLKQLEVRNGQLVANAANIKLAARIKARLSKLVLTKDYVKSIGDYVQGFAKLLGKTSDYYADYGPVKREAMYQQLRQSAVGNAIDALTETGISSNVLRPINELLVSNIASGARYSDLLNAMRAQLTETDSGSGLLSRYAKTYTTTALNQFSGQLNKLMSDEMGFEWFIYTGSNIDTTREWCLHLTKKKYVHKSELPELLKGHIDGHACKIYDRTGLPYGMFETTTVDTLQADCGGWNCGHKFYGIPTESVPTDILLKLKQH